ncbi:hypothetical protein Scep_018796 [Stephania cephalantha]|uniref:Uncharacterized protein n=1 Tax=Stephania cephalantha TaxID=152367 RepID=A0AAP0NKL0_9MAGN
MFLTNTARCCSCEFDNTARCCSCERLEIGAVAEKELQLSRPCDSGAKISIYQLLHLALVLILRRRLATWKWHRNFLMKGFHIVVLLAAGPGIRDTQVVFFLTNGFVVVSFFILSFYYHIHVSVNDIIDSFELCGIYFVILMI